MTVAFWTAVTIISVALILTITNVVNDVLKRRHKRELKKMEYTEAMVADGGENDEH
jgi:hypothetical protein